MVSWNQIIAILPVEILQCGLFHVVVTVCLEGVQLHIFCLSPFATASSALSSTPSNTDSVRAEMRYELEKV